MYWFSFLTDTDKSMSLAFSIPVKCYITPTFFNAIILKKPQKTPTKHHPPEPQKKSELSSQMTIKLVCFFFWKAIFLTGLYHPECTWRKKKSWCSCLAGLRESFVLVMQWPKFSAGVLWRNQCEWGQVQVMVLVSRCVCFSPPPQKENVLRSATAIFSCPHPLLLGSSPFYLNSSVGLTVFPHFAFLLLLRITVPPKFVKYHLLIFTFF